ncbi:PIN domain-containing protein, partial [Comamonas aquatica]|uniref:PIN domain-containing protein n=1 Tax=Comamonas aquatica TaxID=225991 RepID=UPI0034D6B6CA
MPACTDVWLFHSPGVVPKPAKLDAFHARYGADHVTLVERTGQGKNALDFQLSYYAGYLMARQPEAQFVVVSNDKGYEPMLAHARTLEFKAQLTACTKPAMVDP